MVDAGLIVIAIIAVSTLFSVYKIIKSGAKIGNIISVSISILILVLSIVIYLDINDFRSNFETSSKLFLLEEKSMLLSGFSGILSDNQEKPIFLSANNITALQQLYNNKDYKEMQANNYKLFIINITAFDNITCNIY